MAGTTENLVRIAGSDGRKLGLMTAIGVLVAGSQTIDVPPGAEVIGHARIVTGAGALGDLSLVVAATTLTITSSAGTDVSTVIALLKYPS